MAARVYQKNLKELEEADGDGKCKHCLRDFESTSSFLRHVTHSKPCLLAHEPNFIDHLRRDCKRASRLKSYHLYANGPNKEKYKEDRKKRRQERKEAYYVQNKIKHTDAGLKFEQVFQTVFERLVDDAKIKLEILSEKQYLLSMTAEEDALDTVFEEKVFGAFKRLNDLIHYNHTSGISFDMDVDEETRYLKFVFEELEGQFKNEWEKQHEKYKDGWVWDKFHDLRHAFFPFAVNKAFREIYDEDSFKSLYEKACDNALDTIFLKLIPDRYFPDEYDHWEHLGIQVEQLSGKTSVSTDFPAELPDLFGSNLYA